MDYYTYAEEDATGRFVRLANNRSVTIIVEHNTKMAISYRDEKAITTLYNQLTALINMIRTTTRDEYGQRSAEYIKHVPFTFKTKKN